MKQVLQHRIDSTFAHYDVNRNGVIELADIYALANRLLQAFGHLDTDGDGAISVQEYVTAVRDYYTNPAEDTPGSWLYPKALERV